MDWIWFFLCLLLLCFTTIVIVGIRTPSAEELKLLEEVQRTKKSFLENYNPPSLSLHPHEPAEYFDDNTLTKIHAIIQGVVQRATPDNPGTVENIISELQNFGILFRERR